MISLAPSFWKTNAAVPNTASLLLDIASSQYVEYGGPVGNFTVSTAALTLEQWVKHTTSVGTMRYQTAPGAWQTYRAADNTLRFLLQGPSGTDEVSWNVNPPVGVWQHYAFVWQGFRASMQLFVDGVDQGAPAVVSSVNNNSLNPVTGAYTFGAINSLGYTNFFDGRVDEVRIWTTARVEAQIQATYNRAIDPATAGLRNYYQWDGNVFTDVSGGLDVTGFNGASFSVDVPFASSPTAPPVIVTNTKSLALASASSQYLQYDGFIPDYRLNPATGIALQQWVKHASDPAASLQHYQGMWDNSGVSSQYGCWAQNGQLRFAVVGNVGDFDHFGWNYVFTVGSWEHFTFVWDQFEAGTNILRVYRNGVDLGAPTSVYNNAGVTALNPSATDRYRIGAWTTLGGYFDGLIDEVRIWDVALTPAQILANYNQTVIPTGGARDYFRWDGDVYDDLSYGVIMTPYNAPTFNVDVPFP